MDELPPLRKLARCQLAAELRLVPERFQEEALQEAWAAYLTGRSARGAVATFMKREKRHNLREEVSLETCRAATSDM